MCHCQAGEVGLMRAVETGERSCCRCYSVTRYTHSSELAIFAREASKRYVVCGFAQQAVPFSAQLQQLA